MMYEKAMNLPASCTVLTQDEMMYTEGSGAVEAVLGGVLAVGVSAVLLYVGAVAAKGVLGVFSPETVGAVVDGAKDTVSSIVDALK